MKSPVMCLQLQVLPFSVQGHSYWSLFSSWKQTNKRTYTCVLARLSHFEGREEGKGNWELYREKHINHVVKWASLVWWCGDYCSLRCDGKDIFEYSFPKRITQNTKERDTGRDTSQTFCWHHSFHKNAHSQSMLATSTPQPTFLWFLLYKIQLPSWHFPMKLCPPWSSDSWPSSPAHMLVPRLPRAPSNLVFSVFTPLHIQDSEINTVNCPYGQFSCRLEILLQQIMDSQSHHLQLTYFLYHLTPLRPREHSPHSLHWWRVLLSICSPITSVNTVVFLSHSLCLHLSFLLPP